MTSPDKPRAGTRDETLRRIAREHVAAWSLYFAQSGGEPAALFASFRALRDHLAGRPRRTAAARAEPRDERP